MGSLAWLVCAFCSVAIEVRAADPNKPHPNRGVNPPFKAGAPDIKLSQADLDTIARGKTIQRQMINKETNSGTALAILDVAAPVSVVLERIVDFKAYPKMVSGVNECSNYREVTHRNGTQTLLTHMVIKAAFLKFTGYFHHTYYPKLNSVTWTLDYDRTSDFTDSVGYWYVAPHPERPATDSRVFYSVNLLPGEMVPGFVVDILQKQALNQATAWVKLEAEKRAPKPSAPPAGAAGACAAKDKSCVAPTAEAGAPQAAQGWGAWAQSLVGG